MAPYPDPQTAPIMFRPVPHDPMSPYTSVPMAGWTSSPTQRGTIQIIWSCLAVLFICSYKCIHLNIPSRNETASAWLRYRNVPYWPDTHRWRMLLRKVKWMALVLIVPDLGVGMAAFDRMKAEGALKEANKKLPDDWKETPFTLTHAHYAAMGGFIGQDGMPVTLQEYTDFIVNDTLKFSMTVGETASSSLYYRSEAELQALSKSDTITKWLAIGQSLFLVLQCIARRAAGLHYSLLELVTISYVLCSAAMYALWWEKPYDAHNVTILPIKNRGEVRYAVGEYRAVNLTAQSLEDIYTSLKSPGLLKHGTGVLFNGLHLLAWNWPFPDPNAWEMGWLWRAASIASTTVLPLWCLILRALDGMPLEQGLPQNVVFSLLSLFPLLYIICRLTIVGLVFYSVFSMPAGVYQTVQWTAYLPSLS
ncbi:hypothetical protein RB601_003822 [Gaeumannomyces tritici]